MNKKTIYIATHTNNIIYPLVNTLLTRLGHITILNVHGLPKMEDINGQQQNYMALKGQSEALVYDIKRSDVVLLILPAGRGAHIEAGIAIGLNIPVYILDLKNEPIEPLYSLANNTIESNYIRTKEDLVRVFMMDNDVANN